MHANIVDTVPMGTCLLLVLNMLIHFVIFITSVNPGLFAISFANVFHRHNYFCILSAAFVHGSLMHIGMNMMSLLQLGTALEARFGTSQFVYFSVWSTILCGCIYLIMEYILYIVLGSGNWLNIQAVGYSGVLFSYAVLESYSVDVRDRSVFGFFNVPATVYPWVLLIIMSLIMPNVSFLGHLSGILVGFLAMSGLLSKLIPSKEFQRDLEESETFKILYKRPNYIKLTDEMMDNRDMYGTTDGRLMEPFYVILRYLYYLVDALYRCIFVMNNRNRSGP